MLVSVAGSELIVGPAWTKNDTGRYAGRYPLAVERHALAQVGRLLPGVTTVTPHARYYTLHALVAAEGGARGLGATEMMRLVRRCEVVMGAVSIVHHDPHPGMSRAHGSDKIAPALLDDDVLEVDQVAAPGYYAQAEWGFWGPYAASEALLGLVDWSDGVPRPGPSLEESAVRDGFSGLLELAALDRIDLETLRGHDHLCLCRSVGSPDGELLRRRLVPIDARPMELGGRRSQTIKLLLRLAQLHGGVTRVQEELAPFLLFDPQAQDDDQLRGLEITPAWDGVALRALSVEAWRNLWAWLVDQIGGYMAIHDLGEAFAEALPAGSVADYLAGLPDRTASNGDIGAGRLLPAERDVDDRSLADRALAVLCLGALRREELSERVSAYFEGPHDYRERLTPTWLAGRLEDWRDHSLRDFAVFLTEQLVYRSQQIALSKSSFDRASGRVRIPTRVFVREGQIYCDGGEGGGGISLRWDTLATVLGGVGLLAHGEDGWQATDEGLAP